MFGSTRIENSGANPRLALFLVDPNATLEKEREVKRDPRSAFAEPWSDATETYLSR